ncbi:subtilisin-like protein [Tilletiaria anomala UBC 951]|uniref:tripeptidyl-peptidase II n=1 Tax=Tilletiaria anomala (strain ATCC 24038 / CBS 436.72 / UBC 951) TaxID=1037660 RepID=A0A066W6D8_TILAU|nr:subtilisin-like protein [Tilletiaria anomala UBC 951]KDN46654.1 subtilisin-like protein [Tilletiaria anomala UBC 951]
MRIGLTRRGIHDLEARLEQISDPKHVDYGKWLSKDDVDAFLAPSVESKRAVEDWLASHGINVDQISKRSEPGDYVAFETTYAKARAMLGNADFATYQHAQTHERIVRTTAYSLPREVHEHIAIIHPSTNFGSGLKGQSAPYKDLGYVTLESSAGGSAGNIQPLTAGTPMGNAAPAPKGSEKGKGSAQSGQTQVPPDCILTVQKPQVPQAYADGYKFSIEEINGGLNNQSIQAAGGEANLDVQAALLSYPIPTTYYSTGGRGSYITDPSTPTNTKEPYAALFETLLTYPDDKLPSVISNSYDDVEDSVALSYAKRVCQDVLALTSRGITVVFSSGDSGMGGDGKCTISGKPAFLPNFPSPCPYGLSVGATQRYAPQEEAVDSDVAGFYSGGGFSNYFAQPSYQAKAANAYIKGLDSGLTPYYNANGRGYPDVAAQGSRCLVRLKGAYRAIGGTSASAPTFSSVIALLNDARRAQGLPNLGFMNPLLGAAKGCKELPSPANGGFPAAKGWDAVGASI